MKWELDHMFFATPDVAKVERALAEFGLNFSRHVVHQGQGTANACAFFENAFFEVLGVHDSEELQSEIVRPLGLYERIHWSSTGACPFGLCFSAIDAGSDSRWPFETWDYTPKYVPMGASIPIVTPRSRSTDPIVFVTTRAYRRPNSLDALLHRGARRTLTRVRLQRPAESPSLSSGVRWFEDQGLFSLESGTAYSVELEWDHGREGKSHRFDPGVPIVLRW
jgi:hypothetical protein